MDVGKCQDVLSYLTFVLLLALQKSRQCYKFDAYVLSKVWRLCMTSSLLTTGWTDFDVVFWWKGISLQWFLDMIRITFTVCDKTKQGRGFNNFFELVRLFLHFFLNGEVSHSKSTYLHSFLISSPRLFVPYSKIPSPIFPWLFFSWGLLSK